MWVFGCLFSSPLCCGNWLPQHSANSVLDYGYSWSCWGKGSYLCLDMSENMCGVAVDATFPEVALDMSEDEGHSSYAMPGSTVGTCSASVPGNLGLRSFSVLLSSVTEKCAQSMRQLPA